MNTHARQGMGWAILGALLWGLASVIAASMGSDGPRTVVGLIALVGIVALVGGAGYAAVSLIRARS